MAEAVAEKKVDVKVLKNFFELKEGQRLADFAAELKELSEDEKISLCEGINSGSLTY